MSQIVSSPRPSPAASAATDHSGSRFTAAMIVPGLDHVGALAVIDHAGELILSAPLPCDFHRDARDPEGLIAHLTHLVPRLAAVTDLYVSWLPGRTSGILEKNVFEAAAGTAPSLPSNLRSLLDWLGPTPHLVTPTSWLACHGVHPGSTEALHQTCARRIPGLLPFMTAPRANDAVRAAVLLGYSAQPDAGALL